MTNLMTTSAGNQALRLSRRQLVAGASALAATGMSMRSAQAAIEGLVVVGGDGWLFPIWEQVSMFDVKSFDITVKLINEAIAILKGAGVEVAITLNPAKSRIYREYLPSDFQYSPIVERRYAMALEALRKPGTVVPDMLSVLDAAHKANPSELYYFKTDTHWTPAGAALAAGKLVEDMKGRIKLPPSAHPGLKFGEMMKMVQAKNDLSNQLPSSERSKYPPERYSIPKVLEEKAESLLDDVVPDVVVCGNSYTQPKYGFSETLSNQLNRPVGLVWHVHTFGPYAILLDYLQSASFKQHRPKLIVWDLHEIDPSSPPDQKSFWEDHAMPNDAFLAAVRKSVA